MKNSVTNSQRLKSKIFKLEIKDSNGILRDYPVEAYELDAAITALSKKINVPEEEISLSRKKYSLQELQNGIWKNPFIRAHETVDKEEQKKRKRIAQANSEFRAYMRYISDANREHPCLSRRSVFEDEEKTIRMNKTLELKKRYFYTTIGKDSNGNPKMITKSNPSEMLSLTDVNDIIIDDLNTMLLPNTDYIIPVKVNNSSKQKELDSVFRFNNLGEMYRYVRTQLIENEITDIPYNNYLTYIEALDASLANTSIDFGTKRASKEVIDKFNDDYMKKTKS